MSRNKHALVVCLAIVACIAALAQFVPSKASIEWHVSVRVTKLAMSLEEQTLTEAEIEQTRQHVMEQIDRIRQEQRSQLVILMGALGFFAVLHGVMWYRAAQACGDGVAPNASQRPA